MKYLLKNIFRKALAATVAVSLGAIPALGVSADTPSEKDVNLVKGLPYKITTYDDITHSYAMFGNSSGSETDPALGRLTDGLRAQDKSFSNERWHKFYRGTSRFVEFELPETKAVTGFSVSTLQDSGAGVTLSPWFDLYVSENGSDYMLAGRFETGDRTAQTGSNYHVLESKNMGRFKAKYVRIAFRSAVNVYIDEIEVYGGDLDGTEAEFVKAPEPVYKNSFDEGIEGCRDIVLLYCGYPKDRNPDDVQNTEEEMLYFFGYIGKDGEIKDSFFDSFMFSPLANVAPSGGIYNESGKSFTNKEDWIYYLDSIFDDEYNCGAIERAVEKVKKATGKDDLQVSLVINLPYPTPHPTKPFGDINGDGIDEYCRNEDEQFEIYKWYFGLIDEYLTNRNYKNIRFGGYYWEQESMPADYREVTLVRRVIDEAHSRGKKFFWIPLLYAEGYDRAFEYGFDSVTMQPNYNFLPYATEECFAEIVPEIYKHGLGIEIEIHWNAMIDDEYLGRYYSYLNAGYKLGYINGVAHTYYQNGAPGIIYHFAKSADAKCRQAYDDTYAFVKGTYEPHEIELKSPVATVKTGKKVRRAVTIANGYSMYTLGTPKLCVAVEPSHGRVELDKNSSYVYYADDGYVGEDSFVLVIKGAYAESKPLTVNITVNGGDGSDDDQDNESQSADESFEASVETSEPEQKNGGAGKMIAIAGGVAAVLAVAAAVGIKKFKKKK